MSRVVRCTPSKVDTALLNGLETLSESANGTAVKSGPCGYNDAHETPFNWYHC